MIQKSQQTHVFAVVRHRTHYHNKEKVLSYTSPYGTWLVSCVQYYEKKKCLHRCEKELLFASTLVYSKGENRSVLIYRI